TYHTASNLDTLTCSGTYAVSYGHDSVTGGNKGKGRRTSMSDASGSTAWVYDDRGRVLSESKTISSQPQPFVTQWTYDAADRVSTMKYPDNETVTYGYNDQGLLETMATSLSSTINYINSSKYDAAGRLTERKKRNHNNYWTTSYEYYPWTTGNGLGRLKRINTSGLQDLNYTYDAAGNIKTIIDANNSSQRQCFRYDELDRLTYAFTGNSNCTAYYS
ncbi:MAG: hypothetical protein GY753_08270, partial [Gammaproteobacteria bacterium]|nr:hypothetical protein [Gammaproteobacteria bacterium]